MRAACVVVVVFLALGFMWLIRLPNPLWGYIGMYVVAIAGAVAIVLAIRGGSLPKMTIWRQEKPPAGRCDSCGYSLRGLTENRCPECFTEFDPADVPED